jgi:hypothetical protein
VRHGWFWFTFASPETQYSKCWFVVTVCHPMKHLRSQISIVCLDSVRLVLFQLAFVGIVVSVLKKRTTDAGCLCLGPEVVMNGCIAFAVQRSFTHHGPPFNSLITPFIVKRHQDPIRSHKSVLEGPLPQASLLWTCLRTFDAETTFTIPIQTGRTTRPHYGTRDRLTFNLRSAVFPHLREVSQLAYASLLLELLGLHTTPKRNR